MARRATVICKVYDWEGIEWDVRRAEPTALGFSVHEGWPTGYPRGPNGCGGPQWILTTPLVEWLESHRLGATTHIDALPFCLSVLKRLRKMLGHNRTLDHRQWWIDRIDDLATMTSGAFVAAHGRVTAAAVDLARKKLLGPRGQQKAAWRQHDDLILSDRPTQLVAAQLGLAVDVVCKMRWKLEAERGLPHRRQLGIYH